MDLKLPNVLLQDKNCLVAKIADLGLSRQIAEGSLLTNSGHGAPLLVCERGSLAISSLHGLPGARKGNIVATLSLALQNISTGGLQ